MGTRSLTIIEDFDGRETEEIVVMYRQMDGYPEGHGKDLAEFLAGKKIVNGIGIDTTERDANGAQCLAAQIVAHFKQGIGSIYLYPAGTRGAGENYRYYVKAGNGPDIYLKVCSAHYNDEVPEQVLFEGTPNEVLNFIKENEND